MDNNNRVVTMKDCPHVTIELIEHLKAVFSDRVNFNPADPLLAQWAAYHGAFLKMIEYLEKAHILQTKGPEAFSLHELNKDNREKGDQFNGNLEALRAHIRGGFPFPFPK